MHTDAKLRPHACAIENKMAAPFAKAFDLGNAFVCTDG